jgi:hypothetical protein
MSHQEEERSHSPPHLSRGNKVKKSQGIFQQKIS